MHVIVIGGGIGGLCLAQALRKSGVRVEVYERDPALGSRWEGYRIHLDPAGSRSLRACLPDRLWEGFLATSGRGGDFAFVTETLNELVVVEESLMYPGAIAGAHEDHYAVDRRTLRRLLAAGLDDVVHLAAEFTRAERTGDGRVAAVFADGRRAVGDVLVGADGSSSRVRGQYLPQAEPVDAGITGIAHKVFLTAQTRSWVPQRLQHGMNMIMVDAPLFLFTSAYQPPPGAQDALEQATGVSAEGIDQPYVLAALVIDHAQVPDAATMDSAALRDAVDGLVRRWHPDLRRLLAESDPASRGAVEFTASPEVAAWESSNVTLLGDAVHTMPPVGGLGGNAALRDARLLAGLLTAADRGERGLVDAIREYEAGMRQHGYAAVRGALAQRDRGLATGRFGALAVRTFFRACAHVPALRRRAFAGNWDTTSRPLTWELPGSPTTAETIGT